MYNNGEKFRCHIFSMFEGIGKTLTGIILVLVMSLSDEENIDLIKDIIKGIKNGANNLNNSEEFWTMTVIVGLFLLIIIYIVTAYIKWSRTYITVKDNTIFWEKCFLSRVKKSIGIINISNINLEQSLVQRILGISTVKLDTNSKTTAESTDFIIILKKNKAQEFKDAINLIIDDIKYGDIQDKSEETIGVDKEIHKEKVLFELEATKDEVISHGILNINIISLIITVILLVVIIVGVVSNIIDNVSLGDSVKSLGTVIVIGITCLGEVYGILKGFFRYFNYKIKRVDDKIYMSHGFFEKTEYTIPVDKIGAVIIKQSFFARIFHKFRVDIVNIGMGDDKDEETSFLLLYDTEENIFSKLSELLPEFDMEPNLKYNKQPKEALFYKIMCVIIATILWLIAPIVISVFSQKIALYVLLGIVIISLLVCISSTIALFTEGVSVEEKYVKLVSGFLQRSYTWIGYDKIEILRFHSSKFAKNHKIIKGSIYILAPLMHASYSVPFMYVEESTKLNKKVLEQI